MELTANTYLKFIPYLQFDLWDTKRYTSKSISSIYDVVDLSICIKEENKKYKLFEEEDKDFGILGVNNKEGIFDAYLQKGKDINQAYKKMEIGWLAYNPYRINVGSIGVRLSEHTNEYISPAYVVFSCNSNIMPEFLFLLFKTEIFNKVINESTTGSVRQNLTIDILKKLKIPLPPIKEQNILVTNYHKKLAAAENLSKQSNDLESEIEKYFLEQLGLKPFSLKEKITTLQTTDYASLDRWDFFSTDTRIAIELKKSKFELSSIGKSFHFAKRSFNKSLYKKDTFKYIEIGAIDPTKGILEAKEVELKKAPSRATQLVKEGDLIIGTTRPYLKKFAIVSNEYDNDVCSSGFSVIEPTKEYHLPYLHQFLKCSYGIEQLKNKMTGGLYPAITEPELKAIKIPFPKVEVQKEIMTLIDLKKENILNNKELIVSIKIKAEQEFEKAIFNK
ncbi:MAG TPA: restriction endonuclease subunit S [Chitinophagaceae bacterium]|nr:restriction endonuclease subunit S [Chitinophagaceae bacterium]